MGASGLCTTSDFVHRVVLILCTTNSGCVLILCASESDCPHFLVAEYWH